MDFKILKIKAHNFKIFNHIEFDCLGKNAIILGGKNGFGKTTLFDIIELSLTGEIRRYKKYAEQFTDNRFRKNGYDKPLVHDINEKKIWVEIVFQLNSQEYSLRREADSSEMNSHLDFSHFSTILLKQKKNGIWQQIDVDVKELEDIRSNYFHYYYISQEDTLAYLKSKETERTESLLNLFNVSFFEKRITAIEKILSRIKVDKKILNNVLTECKNSVSKESASLNQLKEINSLQVNIPYERIADNAALQWDQKYYPPSFDFKEILGDRGIIKGLLYYISHQQSYKQYKKNTILKSLLKYKDELAFFIHYKKLENEIQKYEILKNKCTDVIESISIKTISTFSFDDMPIPNHLDMSPYKTELNILKIAEKSLANTNRVYCLIDDVKLFLSTHKDDVKKISKCPLCGFDYQDPSKLWESIFNEKQIGDIELRNDFINEIDLFKKRLVDSIIIPQINYYESLDINDEVLTKAKILQSLNISEQKYLLEDVLNFKIDNKLPIQEITNKITTFIDESFVKQEESLDFSWLDQIYNDAVQYINPEKLTEKKIKEKQQYLINEWERVIKQSIVGKNSIIYSMTEKNKKYEMLEKKLMKQKKDLEMSKRLYLEKVINDIKVLFYIYSGRIMQDCFYGRGLFLIYKKDQNYVNFTTNPQSGVDALYNLSSGQLVSLILAFTMSLNKLYRKCDFIFIDDPIQCIDDINMWGFMETIRHEFQGYSFLFSTHEAQYGTLLRHRLDS
ncbi:AAA family ATPase [Candidatus Saccharibacteria bacterium]|nr:AAA family ATPase [Candidatus Saccharibacteria bacterium]